MKRSRFAGKSVSCLFNVRRNKTSGLPDYLKNFSKRQLQGKTLHYTAYHLAKLYNISYQKAYALLGFIGREAMINKNGKVSGGNNTYYFKVYDDLYNRYKSYMDDDDFFKRHIQYGDFADNVRQKIDYPEGRLRIFGNELKAYLQYKYAQAEDLSTKLHKAEKLTGILPLAVWLWSKPAFWLILSALVFDVDEAVAKSEHRFSPYNVDLRVKSDDPMLDFEAIKLGHGMNTKWYDRRSYMSEYERLAWATYDNIVSEVGRELVAAGAGALAQVWIVKGLRLLASSLFNLARFSAIGRIASTVALGVETLAKFVDKSLIFFLLGRNYAIEWQLEKWIAINETNLLVKARDFWAGYKPLFSMLSKDEVERFFELYKLILSRKYGYLDYKERAEWDALLKKMGRYSDSSNIADFINHVHRVIMRKQAYDNMFDDLDYIEAYYKKNIIEDVLRGLEDDYKDLMNKDEDNIDYELTKPLSSFHRDYFDPEGNKIGDYQGSCFIKYKNKKETYKENGITHKNIIVSRQGQCESLFSMSYKTKHCDCAYGWGNLTYSDASKSLRMWFTDDYFLSYAYSFYSHKYYPAIIRNVEALLGGNDEGSYYFWGSDEILYNINYKIWVENKEWGGIYSQERRFVQADIEVLVPFTPVILMLPVEFPTFIKENFTKLMQARSYNCVRWRFKDYDMKYTSIFNRQNIYQEPVFRVNGQGYIESFEGFSYDRGFSFIDTCGYKTETGACVLKGEAGNNYKSKGFNNSALIKSEYDELENIGRLKILQKITRSYRDRSITTSWIENISGSVDGSDKTITDIIDLRVNVGINFDHVKEKIVYLKPVRIPRRRKKAKIICVPAFK